MKVFVYWNLHRKLWSIKALEGPNKGRVIPHARTVLLSCPVPKVSAAGRRRVLRDKRKNVHAGVVGYLSHASDKALSVPAASEQVTYNPYFYTSFVYKADTDRAWTNKKAWALLQDKQVHVL